MGKFLRKVVLSSMKALCRHLAGGTEENRKGLSRTQGQNSIELAVIKHIYVRTKSSCFYNK